MKKKLVLYFSLLLFQFTLAQSLLQLSTGKISIQPTSAFNIDQLRKQQQPIAGKLFVLLQFRKTLTTQEFKQLSDLGIQLLEYIPPFSYVSSINSTVPKNIFQQTNIVGIANIPSSFKLSPVLKQPEKYDWLQGANGRMDVLIKISTGISIADAKKYLEQNGFTLSPSPFESYSILQIHVALSELSTLAAISFVEYIEPLHPPDKTLNEETRYMARANIASAPLAVGGYNLSGKGVVIGVGDNGDPTNHIDLKDRIINRSNYIYNNHCTHVTGTFGGAGISRYLSRGYAPEATIVSQFFGGIYLNAGQYVNDYGMALTNNSYGNIVNDPTYEGVYDLYSRVLDQQAFQYPELLHVFASGNDGNVNISPYPQHYANVLSGYQSAKNVITVGRVDRNMYASVSSSSGPVKDGRLKPEITSLGEALISCSGSGNYYSDWGTSMAAPGVTGGMALMVEQYKKQFTANPKSGLMKAIVMNGGLDIGNPGPDFHHGYGTLNMERSLDMIKNNHFFSGSATTGSLQTQNITVPSNTAQLKIMLYWHDPAAAALAVKTLVNDLDIEVLDNMSNVIYPQKLDTTPAYVANISTTGSDHINNSEQIVVNNPSGTYTIRIKGTAININPSQEYFVAYDYLPRGLHLSVPFEKDTYSPGDLCVIHWSDNGTPDNQRTLEYSLNDGVTWNLISNTISDSERSYKWTIPSGETIKARLRITENATAFSSTSGSFVILGAATPSLAPTVEQCEGYCKLNWPAISMAPDIDYEILLKQGADMVSVGTTTATTFTINGLSKDSVYWFAVRPRKAGVPGKRSDGSGYQPNGGGCSMGISDGDLKLDAILNPNTGRMGTSSALTAATNVGIRIKNMDDVSITGFTVKYSINGNPFVSQTVAATIPAGGTYTHSFMGVDFSQPGIYNITAVVKNNAFDPVDKNDTLKIIVKQLKNNSISLATPFIENFDVAPVIEIKTNVIGIDSIDRWDFISNTNSGRIRTFVNTGIAKSGNRAMTLDVNKYTPSGSTNYLIGTFNLSAYNASVDAVCFDIQFKQHGTFQTTNTDNQIYVRGSESDAWIPVYDLNINQPTNAGDWKKTNSINISAALKNAIPTQNFSSSTQIRFGQNSMLGMGDNAHFGGYTFDDFRLYTIIDDVEAASIIAPVANSCGLNNATPVTVLLKNNMRNNLTNVPVNIQVNGGGIITEMVPIISASPALTSFTFATLANLGVSGTHTIKVWSNYVTDNFRDNDTVVATILNQPVISSFPYLEDFENGNGNFYSGGVNNSWQYGTPNSKEIKTAASGSKAWKTNLQGFYNDEELSYLHTPCFNISGLINPTLSFSMAYKLEYCRPSACDGVWVEYSTDGNTWSKLGNNASGYNWYNNVNNQTWDSAKTYWHVATTGLPVGASNLRLRFVMSSDMFTGGDGVAIDDIHIYDKQFDIYSNSSNSNTITQMVNGASPIHFTDAGQLIATIYPNGNALGNTNVKAYMHPGPVRNNGQQYYADRNIIIQPNINLPISPVTIRFYFLDKETDSLRKAVGCNACTKPTDYTKIGIIKYDDNDDNKENGTMSDNTTGNYSFFNNPLVKKVPYGKGYYAEYSVTNFSEFWLSGAKRNSTTPSNWLSFTAEKLSNNNDVLLQWTTANENDVVQYEVEVAKTNNNQNIFEKLISIQAKNQLGENEYHFTDGLPNKQGGYYYRIKRIDGDGQISYSETKQLLFGKNGLNILIYPNPVKNKLQLLIQAEENTQVLIMLFDGAGKLLSQLNTTATGTVQKQQINMGGFAAGLYQLKVRAGNKEEIIKVVKE